MSWSDKCIAALAEKKLFENSGHRTRFKELLDCYADYPFFNRGLCKCMYLSAWDEEHFCIMLETLMSMSLGQERNTDDMRIQGDVLAGDEPTPTTTCTSSPTPFWTAHLSASAPTQILIPKSAIPSGRLSGPPKSSIASSAQQTVNTATDRGRIIN